MYTTRRPLRPRLPQPRPRAQRRSRHNPSAPDEDVGGEQAELWVNARVPPNYATEVGRTIEDEKV